VREVHAKGNERGVTEFVLEIVVDNLLLFLGMSLMSARKRLRTVSSIGMVTLYLLKKKKLTTSRTSISVCRAVFA